MNATALLSVLCPLLPQGGEPATASLLVRAKTLVVAPGVTSRDQAILVRDGRVLHVGDEIPAEAARAARAVAFAGWVVPGFVSAHAYLGQGEDLAEKIVAYTPELRVADGLDPFADGFARAAQGGITTVAVAPASASPFPGVAALLRCGSQGELLEDGYLKVALVAGAFDPERAPTSLMGAADLLRTRFKAARAPEPGRLDAATQALRAVVTGARRLVVHANTHAEITTACELCEQLALKPILLGGDEAARSSKRLAALQAAVVVPPLSFRDRSERLELPARLHAAGIEVAFSGERGDDLRLSAALAVRMGLPRAAALAALGAVPARLLGLEDRVGTLQRGRFADFVACTGDPLDLTSRIESVWLAGARFEPRARAPGKESQ
jgi:imidazolonepropionase-like amidohydrolase